MTMAPLLTLRCLVLAVAMSMSVPVLAQTSQETAVRGVNPADLDNRADLVLRYNWLPAGAGIFTSTLKYDAKLSPVLGLNIEFPVLAAFRSPVLPGLPGGAIEETGIGDLFLRLRFIERVGGFSYGAGIEVVLPTATDRTLGLQAFQVNASLLAVQAWSPYLITAVAAKATQGAVARWDGPDLQENYLRVIQAFVTPTGLYTTLDLRRNWETVNRRDTWWEGAAEVGMMFDSQTAGSVRYIRRWGDREDRGAVEVGIRRFF